jgi:enoyl-CoA hydratase/carnithine racemase
MDRVKRLCLDFAQKNPGFEVPAGIREGRMPVFHRHVDVTREGGIATVTVKRPEVLNALNRDTLAEIEATMAELNQDATVRGVILTGYKGSLAGADITELAALETPADAEAIAKNGHRVMDRIASMKKPVVAAVDGPVLGGGSEIAMACHARVVGSSLFLGQPEVNLGIIPGYGATQRLPRIVGLPAALELLRTGRSVSAAEACTLGWALGQPASNPVEAAKGVIRQHLEGKHTIGPVDPKPMAVPSELPRVDLGHHSLAVDAILVDVVRRGVARPLPEGLDIEAKGLAKCRATVDFDIGMKNFVQNGPRVPASFLNE